MPSDVGTYRTGWLESIERVEPGNVALIESARRVTYDEILQAALLDLPVTCVDTQRHKVRGVLSTIHKRAGFDRISA